jgi:hypothetical protein
MRFYGQCLAQSQGESLKVIGSHTDAAGAAVTSEIVRRKGRTIKVEWRLSRADDHYK